MSDCTALVVYDDYWQRVVDFQCRILGVEPIDLERLRKCTAVIVMVGECVEKAICRMIDVVVEFADKLVVVIKDTLAPAIKSLSEMLEEVDLEQYDDYDTVVAKMENRYRYVQSKRMIREQQYMRNCFKLTRMHPALCHQCIRK